MQVVQQPCCPRKLECPNSMRRLPFDGVVQLFNVASTAVTKPIDFWILEQRFSLKGVLAKIKAKKICLHFCKILHVVAKAILRFLVCVYSA